MLCLLLEQSGCSPSVQSLQEWIVKEWMKTKDEKWLYACTVYKCIQWLLRGHFYVSGVMIGQRTKPVTPVTFREIFPLWIHSSPVSRRYREQWRNHDYQKSRYPSRAVNDNRWNVWEFRVDCPHSVFLGVVVWIKKVPTRLRNSNLWSPVGGAVWES